MVSVRRVVPVLLLAVTLPLFGATKSSSSRPPRDLHRAGDHWTAYNPPDPATYPAGAKTYAIKSGDTLWTLAQQFYGNAYLWPQLWEANTWITDAHWIYPGDVLLIESEAATPMPRVAAAGTGADAGASAAAAGTEAPAGAMGTSVGSTYTSAADATGGTLGPVPLGTEADVYCYGYIGDPNEPMPNTIRSYEDAEMRYQENVEQAIAGSQGDLVLINGGTATGLVAGDTYMVVEVGEMVPHPGRKREFVGRQYLYRGQLRILCAEERQSRGIITESCAEIHPGARLKPMPQLPIPLARIPNIPAFCEPGSGKKEGWIVGAQGAYDTALGEGILVTVNLGQNDALQPGDFLTVYRENVQPNHPRQVLGEIGVLTTTGSTATGRIVAMRYAMKIGDRVEFR